VKRGERVLPVAFHPARDEAVLGLDLAVASLRTVGVILGALDLQPPLLERLIVILFERFGGLQRGLHAGWGERGEQRACDGLVDLCATDPQAPQPAALGQLAAGAVIRRASVSTPALVMNHQLPPTTAAYRETLQQRDALADRAARLVRARARVTADPLAVGLERGGR
jgi:hypothetical protein